MAETFYFPGVTLMITHYNRSGSLARLLAAFKDLGCKFDDIVVSDDNSKPPHPERLKALQAEYNFRLVVTPKNSGFPVNINQAQDAVKTEYTLYVQEDYVPHPGCQQHLLDALDFMNTDKTLDYIRFWAFYRYPTLKPYGKGFSETIFSPWNLSHLKFFMYSDNPHLRRSTFLQKFGRYQEGIDGNISEHNKSMAYIQKKGRGLFYERYTELFDHLNSPDEPSTFKRASWRQNKNPLFMLLRFFYLRYKWLKCTWHLKFTRFGQ